MRKRSDECSEITYILRDKVISLISESYEGCTFDELRETFENEGVYVDSLCLRKIISDLIRDGVIKKCFSVNKRNKYVFKTSC